MKSPEGGTSEGQTRVKGHSLLFEGKPINRFRFGGGVGGVGQAECTCGARSPELNSGAKRKRWHKQHKTEMAAQQSQ